MTNNKLTGENLIAPKTKLKVRVKKGEGATVELFRPHSLVADKISPLFVHANPDNYCFDEDVSSFRHYIIKGKPDDDIEHKLY